MPVRPVTIAVRGIHLAATAATRRISRLVDLYAGYPELVHGYGPGSFGASDCSDVDAGGKCAVFNNLRGSRMLVANVEVRAPLVGLLKGELDYGRLPVEVAGFFDAGVAWTSGTGPSFAGGIATARAQRRRRRPRQRLRLLDPRSRRRAPLRPRRRRRAVAGGNPAGILRQIGESRQRIAMRDG